MRARSFGLGVSMVLATLGVGAACSRGDAESPLSPESEQPPASLPDAGPELDAGDRDGDVALVPDVPECSTGGWCYTPFPDKDLVFRDVWPLEDRAFAVAESTALGIKFLEWTTSSNAWSYIDDLSQNDHGAGTFASDVYAPNADELFIAVGPAFIFHGRRSGGAWSWTSQRLPDNHPGHDGLVDDHGVPIMRPLGTQIPMLRVWGVGQDEVYAAFSNTVFRLDTTNDTFEPLVVFDDLRDPTEHVYIAGIGGTGADDLWVVGGRMQQSSCPLAVHKTADGLTRPIDEAYDPATRRCRPREDAGAPSDAGISSDGAPGWLLGVISVAPGDVLVNRTGEAIVHIRKVAGDYTFTSTKPSYKTVAPEGQSFIRSVWHGDDETWFSSWGAVFRLRDDDEPEISRLSRDVSPVYSPIYRIRGTATTNLWAIGDQHALHKTTP